MSVEDITKVVSAASLTLLRRDMSLNRRLYAWLLGANHSNTPQFGLLLVLSVYLLMLLFVCVCVSF